VPADFTAMGVLDVGTFDGFYAFLAEHRGARRVLAVDNEQYRVWVAARWGIELEGAAGFRVIHRLLNSRVEYRRMDAFALAELGERFDLVFCFGILHRVENPLGLLRVLRTVTAEGGAVLVETYGTAPIVARAAPGSTSIGSRSATSRSAAVTANILPPRLIEPAISLNPPPCSRQLADFLLLPIVLRSRRRPRPQVCARIAPQHKDPTQRARPPGRHARRTQA
jgi:SAM-dependent methyltransferase